MRGRPLHRLFLPLLAVSLPPLLAGLASGAPAPAWRDAASAPFAVRRGTLTERILLTGRLEAERSQDLGVPRTREFQLQIRWLAEDGAAVKVGDRVAEFDNSRFSSEIEEKRLAAAEAANQLAQKGASGKTAAASRSFEKEKARSELEKARLAAGSPGPPLAARYRSARWPCDGPSPSWPGGADDATQARPASPTWRCNGSPWRAQREVESRVVDPALTLRAPRAGIVLGEHPWRASPPGGGQRLGRDAVASLDPGSCGSWRPLRRRRRQGEAGCGSPASHAPAGARRQWSDSPVAAVAPQPAPSRLPVLIRLDRADPGMRPGCRCGWRWRARAARSWSRGRPSTGAPPTAARLASGTLAEVAWGVLDDDCVLLSGLSLGAQLRPAAGGGGEAALSASRRASRDLGAAPLDRGRPRAGGWRRPVGWPGARRRRRLTGWRCGGRPGRLVP
jgi:hypothetical protein